MSTQAPTKERGWPAYAHEVRAILNGRQTQFRRPMNPQPECGAPYPTCTVCGMDKPPRGRSVPMETASGYCCSHDCKGYWQEPLTGDLWPGESRGDFGYPTDWMGACPFGKPGDRLWLKEEWAMDQVHPLRYPRHGNDLFTRWYGADDSRAGPTNCNDQRGEWRSSIYMPRWAARINLEVTDVRTERVQDISEEDIKAMGITPIMVDSGGVQPWGAGIDVADYCEPFIESWESVNAKRGFGWDVNPFCRCVSFRRID